MFIKTTAGVKIDKTKLALGQEINQTKVYDKNGIEFETEGVFDGKIYVKSEDIPKVVKSAFIAVEDKRFLKHNGVDYIRVFGAVLNNIKSKKFSQGASTITQQLAKNTHLNNEKTLTRKMKEIKLAYKIEKEFSKDEILELYLNNIYFGNGCYGLAKASKFYFDKKVEDLTIGETAMLVGVINAPSYYDPITKQNEAEKRKKVVLKAMLKNKVINNAEYIKSAKTRENIVKTSLKQANIHFDCVLSEVCQRLNINKMQLKNMGLKIYTSIDKTLQYEVVDMFLGNEFVSKNLSNGEIKKGVFIIDNKTKGVVCAVSNKGFNLTKNKRQPGSTIKPLLVYAPAFEDGILYPESIIIDEEININGYSPNNANKRFLGAISVRESIEKSLNVPAVKTLSRLGVKRGKNFAKKLGIEFSKNDNNLALALGGMTEGITIKSLADAYSTFANFGTYEESGFVEKIINSNGHILYEKSSASQAVMDGATAYLVTDVLKGVVQNGTAKRLSRFDFDVASKTGTVGLINSNKNTDAYSVVYTTKHTIVCWVGVTGVGEGMDSIINGSTYPTEMSGMVMDRLYSVSTPQDFVVPDSVIYKEIDIRSLSKNKVELAQSQTENRYKMKAIFNKKHIPEMSNNNNSHKTKLQILMQEGEKPLLKFKTEPYNVYNIYRRNLSNYEEKIVAVIEGDGQNKSFLDSSTDYQNIYEYFIVSHLKDDKNNFQISNSIKVMSY